MTTCTTETSRKIANLSFVCTILVVMIHLGGRGVLNALFAQGVCTIAVPYFFVVSGFFLSRANYPACVVKRLKTLLVPYLFWELVAVAFCAALSFCGNVCHGRSYLLGVPRSVFEIASGMGLWGSGLWSPPSHGALWYVRALLIFVILLPLIRCVVLKVRWWCVGGLWLLSFLFATECVDMPEFLKGVFLLTFPLSGLTYFSAGILLAAYPIDDAFGHRMARFSLPVGLVVMGVMAYYMTKNGSVTLVWRTVFIPCLLGSVWYVIPGMEWPRALTSLSFAIYILHYFFSMIYWWYVPSWVNESIVMFFVKGVFTISGSIAIALLMRRTLPRLYSYAFGGRG